MTRRVVVTGMGGVTSLGNDWPTIRACFAAGKTGIRRMPEWDRYTGVNTRLAAPVEGFDVEERYDRKKLRTMGPVSRLAVYASEQALADAGLIGTRHLAGGRAGVAYGSSFGSHQAVLGFAQLMLSGASSKLNGTSYVQMMSHTTAVNVGLFFGITGRIVPTSSACTSGSQGIGFVNGHGTATDWGDLEESKATAAVLGHQMPIHSLKSYFGHTLGACGSIEAWLGIEMMKEGSFAPTANLANVDERCAELDYVKGAARWLDIEYLMSNNFAFGGINTSLIFKRV